jgi:hypothetical protein
MRRGSRASARARQPRVTTRGSTRAGSRSVHDAPTGHHAVDASSLEPASFGEVLPNRGVVRRQARRVPHRRAPDGRGLLRSLKLARTVFGTNGRTTAGDGGVGDDGRAADP